MGPSSLLILQNRTPLFPLPSTLTPAGIHPLARWAPALDCPHYHLIGNGRVAISRADLECHLLVNSESILCRADSHEFYKRRGLLKYGTMSSRHSTGVPDISWLSDSWGPSPFRQLYFYFLIPVELLS